MNILEKIIEFLTANPFMSEEEAENIALYKSLNRRINKIQRFNKIYLIETRIKPFLQAEYLKNNNLLITEKELNSAAEYEFNYAKRMGFIDDLNNSRFV